MACLGMACLGMGDFLGADGGPHGCAFCLQLRRHLLYPPQQCDRRRRARSCRRRLTLLSLRGFPLVSLVSLVILVILVSLRGLPLVLLLGHHVHEGSLYIMYSLVLLGPALICHPTVFLLVLLLVLQTQHVDFRTVRANAVAKRLAPPQGSLRLPNSRLVRHPCYGLARCRLDFCSFSRGGLRFCSLSCCCRLRCCRLARCCLR